MKDSLRVYSVGYGNRSIDEFIEIVKRHKIEAICDVRSTPYSARFPDFSRELFMFRAKEERLVYVFMGDVLGARPTDPDLYEAGRASYSAMAKSSAFQSGLERLEIGAEKYVLAIMCAEKDPIDCHRAILISRHLTRNGLTVLHIDSNAELESHKKLEGRLLSRYKLEQTSLFQSMTDDDALNEAYEKRGFELAYNIDAAYGVAMES